MNHAVLGALALSLFAAPALAAPAPVSPPWAGYVDLSGAYGFGSESGSYFNSFDFNKAVIHGAARAATMVSPSFSAQADVWANQVKTRYDDGTPDFNQTIWGIAGHFTWGAPGNNRLGAVLSYGGNGSEFVNVGAEAVHVMNNVRLYGQLGYVNAVGGDAAAASDHGVYVGGILTYYRSPNHALSFDLQYSREDSNDLTDDGVSWGARLDFRGAVHPIDFYLQYSGTSFRGHFTPPTSGSWHGIQHDFTAGIRIPLGVMSVEDLDRSVGLLDMNPAFGDLPN